MTKPIKCVRSEDSDQPGHPLSLVRVFAVRMKKAWVLSYPLSAQRRLIRLGGRPGWSESSLGAHAILLVLSWGCSCNTSIIISSNQDGITNNSYSLHVIHTTKQTFENIFLYKDNKISLTRNHNLLNKSRIHWNETLYFRFSQIIP